MDYDKKLQARIIASYPIFGDVDGFNWMTGRLEDAAMEGDIDGFQVFTSETGHWGIQYVLFAVTVNIPPLSVQDVKDLYLPTLNRIVGDTDVEILWVAESKIKSEVPV